MSIRAILLGFAGAAFICGCSYFNDFILGQTYLVGNNMPMTIYGGLVIFAVLINPLLGRFRFRGKELALIVAMTLASCCVPSSGLLRTFTPSLMCPHHLNKTYPGWQQQRVLDMVPKRMLADVSVNDDITLNGFMQGLSTPAHSITLSEVPWYAWKDCLLFWIPLILTLWLSLIALSPMLHRQWAVHEHLPYPVAEFTSALLPGSNGSFPTILRNRWFWITCGFVFLIHFNNFLCRWYPDIFIPVTTSFNFGPLTQLFTTFQRGGGGTLMGPVIYFTVIGLSYFLSSDVVLSCGIGPFIWYTVCGVFAIYGVSLHSPIEGVTDMGLNPRVMLNFGAYFGMFVIILYLGRRYYMSALKAALGIKGGDIVEPHVVWGLRIFLILTPLVYIQVLSIGLDWLLALIYVFVLYLFFIMICRIMAETGIFYIQPHFMPSSVVWALFGASAIGTHQMAIMFMISIVLVIDPRETLLPFITSALKVNDSQQLKPGKSLPWCASALVFGLALALIVTLFIEYSFGVPQQDVWSYRVVPEMPFSNLTLIKQKLVQQDLLNLSDNLSGFSRIWSCRPVSPAVIAILSGFACVILFAILRLRITWWPLHPVMFMIWTTEPQRRLAGAFIMGWIVKSLVQKYGGAKVYQEMKPAMFGLVAGELLACLIPCIICAIYYANTGQIPPRFMILPG